MLGKGWRIPAKDEWQAVISYNRWAGLQDAQASAFKLQGTGELYYSNGTWQADGLARYWSSTSGGPDYGYFAAFSTTALEIRATGVYKRYAYPVRCLMDDVVVTKPTVGGLTLVAPNTTSFSGKATVTNDGGAAVSDRGFVYNTTGVAPVVGDGVSTFVSATDRSGIGNFNADISGLLGQPNYYVWAFATNTEGTALSSREMVCKPVTGIHVDNHNGAPETISITYKVVPLRISGETTCWLAQNLGASKQADVLNESSDEAAGWYWQFNRKQAFKVQSGTRITAWGGSSYDAGNWDLSNDPCRLLLGNGWRLPTGSEWGEVKTSWSNAAQAHSASLKLHFAGYLSSLGAITGRGTSGYYWASDEYSAPNGTALALGSTNSIINFHKMQAGAVRCVMSAGAEALPTVSMVDFTNPTPTSFTGNSSVTLDGGSPVIDRGVVYNTTGLPPDLNAGNIVVRPDVTGGTGEFSVSISGLDASKTYYVWAFAKNANKPEVAYSERTLFPVCPNEFTVYHKGGENGVPVDKTITYKAVSTSLSGSRACWITQNLGASEPADMANEDLPRSRGWFWRYTSTQGYTMDSGTREPLAGWGTTTGNGLLTQDPCRIMLGFGWRMPTQTDWTTADNAAGWGTVDQAHASVLKLHAPGFIGYDGVYTAKGKAGAFWISGGAYFRTGVVGEVATSVYSGVNANYGFSLRCMKPY